VRWVRRSASGGDRPGGLAGRGGASRITARRYLEYLAEAGLVDRVPRYGSAGRPELEYRWR
jgi:response regulator of citrate/malate metabolism